MLDGGTDRHACAHLWPFWKKINGRKNGNRLAKLPLRWRLKLNRHQKTSAMFAKSSNGEDVADAKNDDDQKNDFDNK